MSTEHANGTHERAFSDDEYRSEEEISRVLSGAGETLAQYFTVAADQREEHFEMLWAQAVLISAARRAEPAACAEPARRRRSHLIRRPRLLDRKVMSMNSLTEWAARYLGPLICVALCVVLCAFALLVNWPVELRILIFVCAIVPIVVIALGVLTPPTEGGPFSMLHGIVHALQPERVLDRDETREVIPDDRR